jgi:hypothetical protein
MNIQKLGLASDVTEHSSVPYKPISVWLNLSGQKQYTPHHCGSQSSSTTRLLEKEIQVAFPFFAAKPRKWQASPSIKQKLG